ncbi:ATP-binding protein [Streptomyces xiaopingdaonensis]|uniref:ATP-binding protein n=1 Tax=Streptomyces xiaopingdaonensis TaxID=1565415 RepID=UPI000381D974|nr:ATP-binding protein [Streptomyces xiaopingdaonensis]
MHPSPSGSGHPLRRDQLDYTPLPSSVHVARVRTARLVADWGHPRLADTAALLVSELATNAVLHGSPRGRLFRVVVSLGDRSLRIAVSDARSEAVPRPRFPSFDEQFGRGLLLVDALADRWRTEPRIVGKTVWCELDLDGGESGR